MILFTQNSHYLQSPVNLAVHNYIHKRKNNRDTASLKYINKIFTVSTYANDRSERGKII